MEFTSFVSFGIIDIVIVQQQKPWHKSCNIYLGKYQNFALITKATRYSFRLNETRLVQKHKFVLYNLYKIQMVKNLDFMFISSLLCFEEPNLLYIHEVHITSK